MPQDHLGLFHSELLAFLQQNDSSGLVQDLFQDPFSWEKKLLETGSRIYRGLPRLYHRDFPGKSRLKKEFDDLVILKKMVSEKELLNGCEYLNIPKRSKVCFFTWVIADGWGDYMAAFHCIEILKEKFPSLEIDWIVLFSSKRERPHLSSFCKTHLLIYDEEAPFSLITPFILKILRSAHLIVQIPTYYPSTKELIKALETTQSSSPMPRFISIGEYGFLESQWFHPKSGNCSMGLHFLEKGILIRKRANNMRASFDQIENKHLLKWLFPRGIDEKSYFATHHFYVAYLATAIGGAIYLHALMKAHESSEKVIDICCPNIDWFIRCLQLERKEDRVILENEGWSLDVYTEEKVHHFWNRESKRGIRIFSVGFISSSDFEVLIELSEPLIGVRGDQSFSEMISAGKPFFYDGRDHARYFMKDLLALAENRIGAHKSSLTILRKMKEALLHNLKEEEVEWVEETHFEERRPWKEIAHELGLALQDPEVSIGFKQLAEIICKEHSFNDYFCRLIQKQLR